MSDDPERERLVEALVAAADKLEEARTEFEKARRDLCRYLDAQQPRGGKEVKRG